MPHINVNSVSKGRMTNYTDYIRRPSVYKNDVNFTSKNEVEFSNKNKVGFTNKTTSIWCAREESYTN